MSELSGGAPVLLDISSTSQKSSSFDCAPKGVRGIGTVPRETSISCKYGAPLFGVQITSGKRAWSLVQGNCHHWDCPRCGPQVAAKNYGRIVHGAEELKKENPTMYMVTLTCKGLGLSKKEAEVGYLEWTNRLLSALRADSKKQGKVWAYVQVTERQRRGHPHSHMLTSYSPADLVEVERYKYRYKEDGKKYREYYLAVRSAWLEKRVKSAGLGEQYDIQVVDSIEAVSRYIAKYLFKDTFLTVWPKGWRRVRYSRSWPKLPEREKTAAVPLITEAQWADFVVLHQPKTINASKVDELSQRLVLDRFRRSEVTNVVGV